MNTNNSELKNKATPIILLISSILCGALCFVFGEILLPLPIACLAALYTFDNSTNRRLSLIASIIIMIINIAGLLTGLTFSTFGASAITLAFVMYFAFKQKHQKSDAAFYMTIMAALFGLVSCVMLAMRISDNYTLDGVIEFYTKLSSTLRESFISLSLEAYTSAGIIIDPKLLGEIYDLQMNMIISYLFIAAFLIVGLSFKLFGFIVKIVSGNKEISSWRFFTTNLYAYFYVVLAIVTMFIKNANSMLGIATFNLYYIFMMIYAYIGFNVINELLSKRLRRAISTILLVFALLIFSSITIQLLAFVGVIFTIRKNNEAKLSDI